MSRIQRSFPFFLFVFIVGVFITFANPTTAQAATVTQLGCSGVVSLNITENLAVDDIIVVSVATLNADPSASTVTDSAGNAYTEYAVHANPAGVGIVSKLVVAENTQGLTNGGTIDLSVSGGWIYCAIAVSGAEATPVDTGSGIGTSTTSYSGGTLTAGSEGAIIIGGIALSSSITPTPDSPFVLQENSLINAIQTVEVGANASDDVGGTFGVSRDYAASAIALPLSPAIAGTGRLYYTNLADRTIRRTNLDGSNQQTLITFSSGSPNPSVQNIALDMENGKIYWADATFDQIQRSNLNGSNIETLLGGDTSIIDGPHGIVLDTANNFLYWANGADDTIRRATLDGDSPTTVVNTGGINTLNLAIDFDNDYFYWTDTIADNIARIPISGGTVEPILDNASDGIDGPQAIVLDPPNDAIYWEIGRASWRVRV